MNSYKTNLFDHTYSDNFRPGFLDRIAMKFGKSRSAAMAELIQAKSGTLVDLACGDGDFIADFGSGFTKCIGIDISKRRINNAKSKRIHDNCKFIAHDLDDGIPLPSKCATTVVCEASIAYFRNTKGFFSEVHRILKNDGEFILEIGNYAYLPRRIALLFGKLPKVSSFKGHDDGGMIRYFTYQSLAQQLDEVGFKVTDRSNSGVLAFIRRIWPSLLAPDIIFRVVKKS